METFDDRFWDQLYYGRPPGGGLTNAVVSDLGELSDRNLAVGFHLIWVSHPLRVRGYHIQGTQFSGKFRIWLFPAHTQTGLPIHPELPYSDTGAVDVDSTNPNLARNTVMTPEVYSTSAQNVVSNVRFADFVLANPVFVNKPGLYWICIVKSVPTIADSLYGSYLPGHSRGLRDMLSKYWPGGTVNIGTMDIAPYLNYNPSALAKDQQFYFPDPDPSVVAICNVDVALICERWVNV